MASENAAAGVDIFDDDYQEFDQTSTKKRLTSKVWDEMEKINSEKARYKHCIKILQGKSSKRTIYLKRHLECCPRRRIHDIGQYKVTTQSNTDESTSLKNYKFDQQESRRALSIFLVRGKHHFTIVEEPGFRFFIQSINPEFKNVSRHTARRDIMSSYVKEREGVKSDMSNTLGWICLASNNWRSEHTDDEFMCITAHWIDNNWKLQKRIIRFKALAPPFDGLSLVDEVAMIRLVEYCFDKLYGNEAEEHVNAITQSLHDLFNEYKEKFSSTSFIQSEKTQLDLYLEEQNLDIKANVDVLEYWNKSSIRYPELASMARDILTIPISTVASEFAFSIGKKVINPWRSSLKSKTIQALVCLEDWLRAQCLVLGSNLLEEDEESNSSDNDDENVELDDMF
ncbi:PREDICTED: zinc finger BED domain-containing protein DAYSLEEPER-like [Nelumbo nucifera]|uniref:Zinc finger BED domain-containing protein DAYSLEEPER-like n=1 Tax=Nelumbo nucifera TaxID=4432 RepID=A0A1U8AXF7_NELNU|nr:PREDICTED: zinc finger BED domain-containing protein DAYSLEEPER-like [Nelumbo nucifera]